MLVCDLQVIEEVSYLGAIALTAAGEHCPHFELAKLREAAQ